MGVLRANIPQRSVHNNFERVYACWERYCPSEFGRGFGRGLVLDHVRRFLPLGEESMRGRINAYYGWKDCSTPKGKILVFSIARGNWEARTSVAYAFPKPVGLYTKRIAKNRELAEQLETVIGAFGKAHDSFVGARKKAIRAFAVAVVAYVLVMLSVALTESLANALQASGHAKEAAKAISDAAFMFKARDLIIPICTGISASIIAFRSLNIYIAKKVFPHACSGFVKCATEAAREGEKAVACFQQGIKEK